MLGSVILKVCVHFLTSIFPCGRQNLKGGGVKGDGNEEID
jgi:hypothetical protein